MNEGIPDNGRDIGACTWLHPEHYTSLALLSDESLLAWAKAHVAFHADGEYRVPTDRAAARVFVDIERRNGEHVAEYRQKKKQARGAALERQRREREQREKNNPPLRPQCDRSADGLLTRTRTRTEPNKNKNENENERGGAGGAPSSSLSSSDFDSVLGSFSFPGGTADELGRLSPRELVERASEALKAFGEDIPSKHRWLEFIEKHGAQAFREIAHRLCDDMRAGKKKDSPGAYLNAMLTVYEREHAGDAPMSDETRKILARIRK